MSRKARGLIPLLRFGFTVLWLMLFLISLRPAHADEAVISWQGDFVQGGLAWGEVPAGSSIRWGARSITVDANGLFVLGFDRDAPATVSLDVTLADGRSLQEVLDIAPRQYRIQRVDGVPARTVNPNPADYERIRRESVLVRKAREQLSERYDFKKTFKWPLIGPITGVFGSQRVYNGEPRRPHYGVDVAAPTGTVVTSPMSGTVLLSEPDLFFSGGTLIIDHGFGVTSTMMHLSKLYVRVGEEIQQGQEVAEVGATGRATGPHLDWRMNWLDQRIDPQLLVDDMPDSSAPSNP